MTARWSTQGAPATEDIEISRGMIRVQKFNCGDVFPRLIGHWEVARAQGPGRWMIIGIYWTREEADRRALEEAS